MIDQKFSDLVQAIRHSSPQVGYELVKQYRAQQEKRPRSNEWDDFWYTVVARASKSGIEVSEYTAMNLSTVWAAVKIISESIGSLPLITYEKIGKRKERAHDHSLYDLLHLQPNPEMTAMQYREAAQGHLLLWGNHYSQIERSLGGKVIGLWPLRPDRMIVKRPEKEIIYEYYMTNGEKIEFPSREILHIGGLGSNGLMGYSVIQHHRDAIGLALAGETFQSRVFKNDASPSGILSTESTMLNEEKAKVLRDNWYEAQGGIDNAGKIAVMTHGLKFQAIGMPPKDVEFLGLRKFQVLEICRIFNLAPPFLQDWDKSNFTNIEQATINLVMFTLRPWLVRIEQAMMVKLLSKEERQTYSIEHLIEGLLRGDTKSRYEAYGAAIKDGWMSRNEAREKENLNPQDGLDEFLTPFNMAEVGKEPSQDPKTEGNGNGEDKETLKKLREYMGRMTREMGDIRKKLNLTGGA